LTDFYQSDNVLNLHHMSTSLQCSRHNRAGSKTKRIRPRPRPVWGSGLVIRPLPHTSRPMFTATTAAVNVPINQSIMKP